MNKKQKNAEMLFTELLNRHAVLAACKTEIHDAYSALKNTYQNGGKVLVAGNGGSAADSEHIVGELMKSFLFHRKADTKTKESLSSIFGEKGEALSEKLEGCLPAIPLTGMPALSSAFLNDVDPLVIFAQMVYGYGVQGDAFLGISTSGNSKNILNAAMTARAKGLVSIGLTGGTGGQMKDLCDLLIIVPEKETFKVQELHLPIYHTLCAMLEADFFEER
jgi:D-sedoheptulose 7-phosphate isomerase